VIGGAGGYLGSYLQAIRDQRRDRAVLDVERVGHALSQMAPPSQGDAGLALGLGLGTIDMRRLRESHPGASR